MATLSSPGIGTGFKVTETVQSLVAAEREPFDKKKLAAENKLTEQISGLGKLKSALSDLDDTIFDLKLPTTFSKRQVDYSSDFFTAEAGSAASVSSYDVQVNKVAAGQKVTTGPIDASAAILSG